MSADHGVLPQMQGLVTYEGVELDAVGRLLPMILITRYGGYDSGKFNTLCCC